MDIEIIRQLNGEKLNKRNALLTSMGLTPDNEVEETVLVWDNGVPAATGSRQGNLLKCIAVDSRYQGEGLTATVLTALRQSAFNDHHRHLFLYTKPKNREQFRSLFFYPIAATNDVLLMEDRKNGITHFLETLPPKPKGDTVGAIVMNCDPFTLGHRYLIETAAKACDSLCIFVLSEDKGKFSAQDRLQMVKDGTADIPNVTVMPTGPYLISSATFPTYFLKERNTVPEIHCRLDIAVFTEYYMPRFGITRRFVGEEPLCPVTRQYNESLKKLLPIPVTEIPRLTQGNSPISAGAVRRLLIEERIEEAKALVPPTTAKFF